MYRLLATFAAVSSLAVAAPLEHVERQTSSANGWSIQQQPSGQRIFKNGAISVMKAYQKYNAAVPVAVQTAATAAILAKQNGSVVATPESYDEAYLCPVAIGTPAQTLMMDFDTGSSDFWVFSSELPANESAGHTLYTPSKSSTSSLESGETWNIEYGDGSGASGNVYSDKVVIGRVTATSQAVEAATSVSSAFTSDTASDGLVGLAFDSLNTVTPNPATTFFFTVEATLPSELFTATLKHNGPGTYDFGFLNSSKYTGALTYTPITSDTYWEFSATGGYAVGTKSYTTSIGTSIADTGTTLLYLPSALVANYYAQVKGSANSNAAGGYIFPCSATLPNLNVTIGGASHMVPGSYMNYAPYTSTQCFGGLQVNTGLGLSIFGDIFLKSQYVVFDAGNNRIGFAQQK